MYWPWKVTYIVWLTFKITPWSWVSFPTNFGSRNPFLIIKMLHEWELTLKSNFKLLLQPGLRNKMLIITQYVEFLRMYSILMIKNGFLDPKLVGNDTQLHGVILKVNHAMYVTFQGQYIVDDLNITLRHILDVIGFLRYPKWHFYVYILNSIVSWRGMWWRHLLTLTWPWRNSTKGHFCNILRWFYLNSDNNYQFYRYFRYRY